MYSIEEVVKKHLQEEYCKKCTERNDCSFDIDEECSSVFMKKLKIANLGAVWILSHQWTNVKDRLPDKNEQVLCKMKSNVAVIYSSMNWEKHRYPQTHYLNSRINYRITSWGGR